MVDLFLFRSPVGHIFILISRRTHTYSDSSYAVLSLYIYLYRGTYPHTRTYNYLRSLVGVHRTYAYIEVPLGTIRLILIPFLRILYLCYKAYSCILDLILVFRILYLYLGTYSCISDLILILQSIYLYLESYTCITELILIFRILYLYYRAYNCISDFILILRNLYLFYRYGSTRRYYRDFTCTKVLVGTIEQIRKYPYVHSDLYHIHFFTLILYSESYHITV